MTPPVPMNGTEREPIDLDQSWHGRKVFDADDGTYLGRAVGDPWSDGVEGVISLRQDEEGQTIKAHALCAFVVLDEPPQVPQERQT